jgi:ketosteroid isomerase-like protein
MALADTKPLERFYEKMRFSEDDAGSFEALIAHWRQAFGDSLDPELEFHEPGMPGMPPQIYRGPDEIIEGVIRPLPNTVKELRIEPTEFIAADDAVVVLGYFRGTTQVDRELNARFANIWRIKNGRAIRHEAYTDSAAFLSAIGLI